MEFTKTFHRVVKSYNWQVPAIVIKMYPEH